MANCLGLTVRTEKNGQQPMANRSYFAQRYLTISLVRYQVEHLKRNSISTRSHVLSSRRAPFATVFAVFFHNMSACRLFAVSFSGQIMAICYCVQAHSTCKKCKLYCMNQGRHDFRAGNSRVWELFDICSKLQLK